VNSRTCKRCAVDRPIGDFETATRGAKTWRLRVCRSCRLEVARERRAALRDPKPARAETLPEIVELANQGATLEQWQISKLLTAAGDRVSRSTVSNTCTRFERRVYAELVGGGIN
jgi:hypothetical protein